MPSPDGRHIGRRAAVKLGIGLHRIVQVGVTPEGQVVQRHRRLHEVALCILGWLQPGKNRLQMAHHGCGIVTHHWTHLQQPMLLHSFMQLLSSGCLLIFMWRACKGKYTVGPAKQRTKDDHPKLTLAVR